MELSETILAAMIGALATVSVAVFQLFAALKSNDKPVDARAKRGGKIKSLLSVAALMVASGVGGFLYSEFLKQRGLEQMQAMRDELREVKQLAALAAGRSALPVQPSAALVDPPAEPVEVPAGRARDSHASTPPAVTPVVSKPAASTSEALIYVHACQAEIGQADIFRPDAASDCQEDSAQRVALCGTVPADARVSQLELFAQPEDLHQPWEQHAAILEQDLGGARFTGKSFEYAQSGQTKAVCVNFMHWNSVRAHKARLVVHYDREPVLPAAGQAEAAVITDQASLVPQAASFITPGAESQ